MYNNVYPMRKAANRAERIAFARQAIPEIVAHNLRQRGRGLGLFLANAGLKDTGDIANLAHILTPENNARYRQLSADIMPAIEAGMTENQYSKFSKDAVGNATMVGELVNRAYKSAASKYLRRNALGRFLDKIPVIGKIRRGLRSQQIRAAIDNLWDTEVTKYTRDSNGNMLAIHPDIEAGRNSVLSRAAGGPTINPGPTITPEPQPSPAGDGGVPHGVGLGGYTYNANHDPNFTAFVDGLGLYTAPPPPPPQPKRYTYTFNGNPLAGNADSEYHTDPESDIPGYGYSFVGDPFSGYNPPPPPPVSTAGLGINGYSFNPDIDSREIFI